MECGKLTAKLRDAVPVCFLVDGKEVKRYKNIEIPDEIKKLQYTDFRFDVPVNGAITFKIMFEQGILPDVWPEARQRQSRKGKQPLDAQKAQAKVEATIEAGLEQAGKEGQPIESEAAGIETTAEIIDNELITAEEPESMEIAYNLTGERRKPLVEAISQYTGEKPIYQNAPTFAYKIGGYTVDKNGTLTGPNTAALIESLSLQGFDAE